MAIKFRRSTAADGQCAMRIWKRAVDATHDFLSEQDRHDIEQELEGFLPNAPLWLAVDCQDRALGFMLLTGSHMDALFVDPDCRSTGVGRALVEHGLSLCPALTTDVNEQNAQAVGFYERMGFQRAGRSPTDDQGRPYPLIHLRYVSRECGSNG
uniref:acetyltransferase n=1 Tax=Halomonas sp. TaxID=1486246 RepID=UPI002602B704|nr:acetyltransferase [Halomonas sp.]